MLSQATTCLAVKKVTRYLGQCFSNHDCPDQVPDCLNGICRNCSLTDAYLPVYSDHSRMPFNSLDEAMYYCNLTKRCRGVTFETEKKEWTLRASNKPRKSNTKEVSILKSCYQEVCKKQECSRPNCKISDNTYNVTQTPAMKYCETYCIITESMLTDAKKRDRAPRKKCMKNIPKELIQIISCHSCKDLNKKQRN